MQVRPSLCKVHLDQFTMLFGVYCLGGGGGGGRVDCRSLGSGVTQVGQSLNVWSAHVACWPTMLHDTCHPHLMPRTQPSHHIGYRKTGTKHYHYIAREPTIKTHRGAAAKLCCMARRRQTMALHI